MSYDNPATHGLFEELLAGATAVKERPQLIAERDSALSEVEFHKSRLNDTQTKFDEANTRITELEDKLRGMEDAYQAATFRETEVRAKLETLVTSFKNVIGEVKAAADLANELVEEPKPAISEPDGIDNSVVVEPVSVSPDPIPAGDSTTGTTTISTSTDVSEPSTDLPGKFPWETPKIGDAEDASMHGYTPEGNQYYGPGGVYHQAKEVTITSDLIPVSKPYWEKPSSTTWFDWRALGNDIAPWCKNASDESLRNLFN